MKINELFEALPGAPKQGLLSRMFGGDAQAKRMKASIDQGVKSWIDYATQYGRQNPTFLQDPVMYSKVFRQWASKAANLNVNHPAFNDIETGLATTLRGRSTKPIEVAITKLVNLTQSMAANPEGRYTSEMKAQAVSKLIDQKYGRYIKNIATKQAIDKFINDTIKADPTLKAEDLQKAAEAEVIKIVNTTQTSPTQPTKQTQKKSKRLRPGAKVKYAGKTYTWANNAWRSGTEVLGGSDAQQATANFRNTK